VEGGSTKWKPYYLRKNGIHYTATFHGSKEIGRGLEMKIKKEMGLK